MKELIGATINNIILSPSVMIEGTKTHFAPYLGMSVLKRNQSITRVCLLE